MAECPCTNISIMQLFYQLKQKFPDVPDRIVTECIQMNAHDKEACEAFLSKENPSYNFPCSRGGKMAEGNHEICRPDSLQLEDTVWDFDRRLIGRQSLDSLRCTRGSDRRMCKQYSEEFLNHARKDQSDRDRSAFSRLSIQDDSWHGRRYQEEVECNGCDLSCHVGSEGSCHCERTRVSVVSYGSGSPHSAPVTPSNYPPLKVDVTTERRRTKLNVEPTPHYQGLPEPVRPYTSVNLTLRPPSSEPQPPIDIRSEAGGLTYSSCSYDPRQGYQSRLQISIGPGGQGTVTAARTMSHRIPPTTPVLRPALSLPNVTTTSSQLEPILQNLPPATKVLVTKQLERKERLSHELSKYKERLIRMNLDVQTMRADLEARLKGPSRVKKLQDEIILLQNECKRMADEVDRNAKIRNVNVETLPLGETNEEFYKNIYRGQLLPRQIIRPRSSSEEEGAAGPVRVGVNGGEGRNWTCDVCTFRNHPALDKCEQCDMPRIITGSSASRLGASRSQPQPTMHTA